MDVPSADMALVVSHPAPCPATSLWGSVMFAKPRHKRAIDRLAAVATVRICEDLCDP
jgi:hypothetical protein